MAGLVTDSAGIGIAGATITIVNQKTGKETTGETTFNGRFAIPGLELGVPYTVRLTKLEHYPVIKEGLVIPESKVLRPTFVMHVNRVQQLERVTVTEKPKGSPLAKSTLTATEIAKANVPNMLDAINRLRPRMLAPSYDICVSRDSLSLYVDGLRRPLFNPVETGGPLRTVTRLGTNRAIFQTTGRTNEEIVQDELSQIPSEDIAEVIFVSCDEVNPDVPRRNVIWMKTKRYKAAEIRDKMKKGQIP